MYRSKDGWMDKNRSAGRNEHLEVKRQRGNGEGVFDSEVLQSSFYPSFFEPGKCSRRHSIEQQSLPGLIPLPFHSEILYSRAAGSSASITCSGVLLRSGKSNGTVCCSFAE